MKSAQIELGQRLKVIERIESTHSLSLSTSVKLSLDLNVFTLSTFSCTHPLIPHVPPLSTSYHSPPSLPLGKLRRFTCHHSQPSSCSTSSQAPQSALTEGAGDARLNLHMPQHAEVCLLKQDAATGCIRLYSFVNVSTLQDLSNVQGVFHPQNKYILQM